MMSQTISRVQFDPSELDHHVAVEEDAEDGHQRHPWRAEGARLVGVGVAQDEDGDADDDEGEQGADVDHLADVVDGGERADDRRRAAHQEWCFSRACGSWGWTSAKGLRGSRPSLAMA